MSGVRLDRVTDGRNTAIHRDDFCQDIRLRGGDIQRAFIERCPTIRFNIDGNLTGGRTCDLGNNQTERENYEWAIATHILPRLGNSQPLGKSNP